MFTQKTQTMTDHDWSFSELGNKETNKLTHGYHRYPAKFIPQLVEKLIKNYIEKKSAIINDPFIGSGTTAVSAISNGHKIIGTDINRISYLITKVKATPIESIYLQNKINNLMNKIEDLEHKRISVTPIIPKNHTERIDYWFSKKNKIKLGKILKLIEGENDKQIKNFELVAFSHILKNCSFWLKSSVKPTKDYDKKPSDPYKEIISHLKFMLKGNESYVKIVPKKVMKNIDDYLDVQISDAKNQNARKNSVDMVITSSPYVISYEYADLHQLSTIWLNLADNLLDYKRNFIGSNNRKYVMGVLSSHEGNKIVKNLGLVSNSEAKRVEAFFIDMQNVINESYRILKSSGKACYVIGNTEIKNVKINNKKVFIQLMTKTGFKIEKIIERKVSNKMLPSVRDSKTGRFTTISSKRNKLVYPKEYIIIANKN